MSVSTDRPGMLSQTELERYVAAGEIDTVIVAFTDMQGRLTGKRDVGAPVRRRRRRPRRRVLQLSALRRRRHGTLSTATPCRVGEAGYGDMVMTPDFGTLRLLPWLPGTALVMADLGCAPTADPVVGLRRAAS